MRLILTTIILTMLAQPVWAERPIHTLYCETTSAAEVFYDGSTGNELSGLWLTGYSEMTTFIVEVMGQEKDNHVIIHNPKAKPTIIGELEFKHFPKRFYLHEYGLNSAGLMIIASEVSFRHPSTHASKDNLFFREKGLTLTKSTGDKLEFLTAACSYK